MREYCRGPGSDEETKNSSHITSDWDVNVDRINGVDDRTIDIIVRLDGKSASIKN